MKAQSVPITSLGEHNRYGSWNVNWGRVIVKSTFLTTRLYYLLSKQEDLNWGPCWPPRLKSLYRHFSNGVSFCNVNWKEHDWIIKEQDWLYSSHCWVEYYSHWEEAPCSVEKRSWVNSERTHTCLARSKWMLSWRPFFCFLLEVVNSTTTHFDCPKFIDSCLILQALRNFPRDVSVYVCPLWSIQFIIFSFHNQDYGRF